MKKLLLITVLGGGLAVPPNKTVSPVVLSSVPATIQPVPQPQVAIIPIAIGVGIVVGVAGWGAFKIADKIIGVWEHKLTNAPAGEVKFTFAEDEYPE